MPIARSTARLKNGSGLDAVMAGLLHSKKIVILVNGAYKVDAMRQKKTGKC